MQEQIIRQIVNIIERSQKILVLPSSPPDGDSIGSALALYEVLKKLGKEVTVVCADSVPDVLRFLPNNEIIRDKFNPSQDFIVTLDCSQNEVDNIRYNVEKDKVNLIITPKNGTFASQDVSFHYGPSKFDLIVTVDTATVDQLGVIYQGNVDFFYNTPLINIDHHASNEYFGTVNLIDVTAASATEILFKVIQSLEKSLDKEAALIDEDIATLLLAGIITDTGSFQNANTTPKSFAAAAALLRLGARQQEIVKNVYKTKELSTLKLWGTVLSRLRYDRDNRLVWSVISLADFAETGSKSEETGGIIDELMSNAPGAEIIVLMKEKEGKLVSCSLRTTTPAVNASDLAGHFGGGGHPQAAGFRLRGKSLEEAEQEILAFLKEKQHRRLVGDIDYGFSAENSEDTENSKKSEEEISSLLDESEENTNTGDFSAPATRPEKAEDTRANEDARTTELENPLAELIGAEEDQDTDRSDANELGKIFYQFRDNQGSERK